MRIEQLGEFPDLSETHRYVETAKRMLISECSPGASPWWS